MKTLPLRYAEGPEHFDCAQYKLRRKATGRFAKLKAVVQHVHKNDERFLI